MIRDAAITDIGGIRAVLTSVDGFWDESWRPDVLKRVLTSPDAIALVHEDGEVVDGFVCAHDVGFRAYLSELVVAPAIQGRGIGALLLAEIERRMSERGCAVMIADVWVDAERFYRSRGWTPPSVTLLRKRLLTRVVAILALVVLSRVSVYAASPPIEQGRVAAMPLGHTCKTNPNLVGGCFATRGRIQVANGSLNVRLWRVGTNRLVAIVPDEDPIMPVKGELGILHQSENV